MTTLTQLSQLDRAPALQELQATTRLREHVADAVIRRHASAINVKTALRVVPRHFQQDPVIAAFVWLAGAN
jgi:predicted hydrolase (HD superfamily)